MHVLTCVHDTQLSCDHVCAHTCTKHRFGVDLPLLCHFRDRARQNQLAEHANSLRVSVRLEKSALLLFSHYLRVVSTQMCMYYKRVRVCACVCT